MARNSAVACSHWARVKPSERTTSSPSGETVMTISAMQSSCSEPEPDRHRAVLARTPLNARTESTRRLLHQLRRLGAAIRRAENLEQPLRTRVCRKERHVRSIGQDEAKIAKTHAQVLATHGHRSAADDATI